MNRRWLGSVLRSSGLVVVLGVVGGCCLLPPPSEPNEVVEDAVNIIHRVDVDQNGRGSNYEEEAIPDDAFSVVVVEPELKLDDFVPAQPDKIHPMLLDMMAEDANVVVSVIILLQDNVQVPRFPDLPEGVERGSPTAQRLSAVAAEMINNLLAQRRQSTEAYLAEAAGLGIQLAVSEQFWIIDGFLTEVRLRDIGILAESPNLTYIQPRSAGEQPPLSGQDNNADNDVDDGRDPIGSDAYFGLALWHSYIGLLDTGIRTTHQLFNNPSHVDYIRDCVNGGTNCDDSSATGWNPNDDCWNHGTSSASILVGNNRLGDAYRGVTEFTLDSWQIYGHAVLPAGCSALNTAAAVRAIQQAIAVFDRIILCEIQATEGENGAIALGADNAYDAGAIVIAACGNGGPGMSTVGSPGKAHKVIAVGAYEVLTGDQVDVQSRGPAADGRYKPELQAPTRTETGKNISDDRVGPFINTSGAAPYAAGAAALMRGWLTSHHTYDNGQVYSRLILCGPRGWPQFDNTTGVGPLQMPTCGTASWGKVSVSHGTVIDLKVTIGPNRSDLEAALWWPEGQKEQHDDIDLYLIDPTGTERAKSNSSVSIFERARVGGGLTQGTWIVRIKGYLVQSGPQTVYWTFDVHGCN